MTDPDRLTRRSIGGFDPQKWIGEGDGLFASSRDIRQRWIRHRSAFSARLAERDTKGSGPVSDDWALLTGLPRAAMLLLGYASEVYLKAALAKAYVGCATDMFERDVKSRFGHRQNLLADDVAFPRQEDDHAAFDTLQSMVLIDARYPLFVAEGEDYATAINQQTRRMWSAETYAALAGLVDRVRAHVTRIDQDPRDPSHRSAVTIDQDGYLAFRTGGHLPPRITYRLSSRMVANGQVSVADVRSLIEDHGPRFALMLQIWDSALIYEERQTRSGKFLTEARQTP